MRRYDGFSKAMLENEKARLIGWLRNDKPRTDNRFECDRHGGEAHNLIVVAGKLKALELAHWPDDPQIFDAYLSREGIGGETLREKIIGAIGYGYAIGLMESL